MQLPPEIRKCVCYVGVARDAATRLNGTAFLVSLPASKECGRHKYHVYAVTAKHVLVPEYTAEADKRPWDEIWLEINTKDGGVQSVEVPLDDWVRVDGSDVAVAPVVPSQAVFDYLHYPIQSAATRAFMTENRVFPGEDVVMSGLLVHHPGESHNLPIIRIGNLAALPNDPINLSTGPEPEAALVEVRSIGGLSGSPVFLHLSDWRRDENGQLLALQWPEDAGADTPTSGSNYLLGLVHGYFPSYGDPIDHLMPRTDDAMNVGITIIVPVERIAEIIYGEDLSKNRAGREADMKKYRASPQAGGWNP